MSSKTDSNRLIPGLLTNVEIDRALGSPRKRQRWERDGLLPRGRWLKGYQKRLGLYPEIVLARVVGGVDARESEQAVREAMAIGTRLVESPLFEEIGSALGDVLGEFTALNCSLLDYVNERGLLEPLQDELSSAGAALRGLGIDFRCQAATVTRMGESLAIIDALGEETLVAGPQVLGVVEVGDHVVIEEVHVGPRAISYVLPAAPGADDPRDELWSEMFASLEATPVPVPLLDDEVGEGLGGDVVRAKRRLRIELPAELYATANPMTRSAATIPAD